MTYRITPSHIAFNAVRFSQSHLSNLARLQQMLSTGLRISKPSDDPGGISPLLANKSTVKRIEIDLQNIQAVRSELDQSVAQLTSARQSMADAISTAVQGVQADPIERDALARSIDGIIDRMLEIANTSEGGRPLYAGTSNNTQPFQVAERDEDGSVVSVDYHGSVDRARVVVGMRTTVDVLYAGNEIFQTQNRAPTVIVGKSGAQPGSGTDNGVGQATLQVRHVSTTFGGTSGAQAGTGTANDTLLGDHTLTINATARTLQLDDGTPVTYAPGDTNVQVESFNGIQLHVDTTGITAGFAGTITVRGDGTLSTDEGLTQIPIDFSANQVVANSVTGQVTNIDTRTLRRASDDHLEYSGTSDVFGALVELRDDLRNKRNLSPQEVAASLNRRIGELTRVTDNFLAVIGEQSVSLTNLDAMQTQAEDLSLTLKENIGAMETADVADVAIKLQTERTALQFTYSAAMTLMDTTILDFLR